MNLPNTEINKTMYVADLQNNDIWSLFATHESETGKSILTDHGKVYRTNTKHIKIMYSYDFALFALKTKNKQFDDEYKALAKKLKLKIKIK
jgi:hypothetical protein